MRRQTIIQKYSPRTTGDLLHLLVLVIKTSLMYFIKYTWKKIPKSDMCCTLMLDIILRRASPTGMFSLRLQGYIPWNPNLSVSRSGRNSSWFVISPDQAHYHHQPQYPMTYCINVVFCDSDTVTARSKYRQGSLFIILISEPVYSILRRHGFRICSECGFQWWPLLSPAICTPENFFFWSLLYDLNHNMGDI